MSETHNTGKVETRKGRTFAILSESHFFTAGRNTGAYTTYTFAEVIDRKIGPVALCGVTTIREVRAAIREYVDGKHDQAFA